MSRLPNPEASRLFQQIDAGDAAARGQLFELVYDEMHAMAQKSMRAERPDHTLQPTALVNEVWLRLMGGDTSVAWQSRAHFLCTASRAMRRVLVDHARGRDAAKRGAGKQRVELDETVATFQERALDLVALDDALERLGAKDAELARIVELRFFGGLGNEETGRVLGLSVRQVEGAWVAARGWLKRELDSGGA